MFEKCNTTHFLCVWKLFFICMIYFMPFESTCVVVPHGYILIMQKFKSCTSQNEKQYKHSAFQVYFFHLHQQKWIYKTKLQNYRCERLWISTRLLKISCKMFFITEWWLWWLFISSPLYSSYTAVNAWLLFHIVISAHSVFRHLFCLQKLCNNY